MSFGPNVYLYWIVEIATGKISKPKPDANNYIMAGSLEEAKKIFRTKGYDFDKYEVTQSGTSPEILIVN